MIEANGNVTGPYFKNKSTKRFVSGVTLSLNDEGRICIKCLEHLKQGFKRTISSKKYRSETTTQSKNNNLDHMIVPTFRNTNRLFAQLFKADENDPAINYFLKHYLPLAEIEDYNVLIKKTIF